MPGPLSIDWKPLDFSELGNLPLIYQAARKASLQEKYAANQDRKMSADMARANWQDQRAYANDTFAREKEIAAAGMPGSPTMRAAAAGGAAAGNAAGRPFGIHFEEQSAPSVPSDPGPVDPQGAPLPQGDSNTAQFLLDGGVPRSAEAAIPDRAPLQGPMPNGGSVNRPISPREAGVADRLGWQQLGGKPYGTAWGKDAEDPGPVASGTPAAAAFDADAELNKRAPIMKRLFATVRGSRFEVKPEVATAFPEEQYNKLVEQQMAGGIDREHAIDNVGKTRSTDIGQFGQNTRHEADVGLKRDALAETTKYHGASLGQSDINNRRNNAAKIEAAKLIGMGMNEKTAVSLIGQYRQFSDSAQRNALMKQDQQGMRLEDRIAAELDPTSPNALNQQMANHSLAALSVSTGAGAGRVPVSVIHDIRNAYSAALSAKNWAYKQLNGGENLPEVVQLMNNARLKIGAVSKAQRVSDLKAWNARAGYGSVWATNPETRGLVDSEHEAVMAQLGLTEEDLAGTNMSAAPQIEAPGMDAPPPMAAPERGPGRRKMPPAAAPRPAAPPAGGNMVEITNKKTGEKKMVTPEQAKAMGAM